MWPCWIFMFSSQSFPFYCFFVYFLKIFSTFFSSLFTTKYQLSDKSSRPLWLHQWVEKKNPLCSLEWMLYFIEADIKKCMTNRKINAIMSLIETKSALKLYHAYKHCPVRWHCLGIPCHISLWIHFMMFLVWWTWPSICVPKHILVIKWQVAEG